MEKLKGGIAPEQLGPTITIGEILVEIMASERGDGFLDILDLTGPYPSGAPAIFIDQVARLGGAAGIIATVGDDDFGKLNVSRLERDGVDVSAISVSRDRPTGSAFVRYRHDGSRDFVFNIKHSAAGSILNSRNTQDLIARAGHVHVMGSAFSIPGASDVIRDAISAVQSRGGSVSFDPNIRKELLREKDLKAHFDYMLENTTLLLPSGEELTIAAGVNDEVEAVEILRAKGMLEIVLKRGEKGATYFGPSGERQDFRGFVVDEVDPTGAGDAFGATYLTSRRLGFAPGKALERAAAAGARNVTRQGPMEGIANTRELEAFVASATIRT